MRHHRPYLGMGLVAALLLLGACSDQEQQRPTAPPTTPPVQKQAAPNATVTPAAPSPENGKKLFQQTCAACHGMEGQGMPNLGKDMRTSTFIQSKSDAELLAFVKQGRMPSDPANTTGVAMPPKGGNPALQDDQLRDIIAYIRTLQK